MRGAQPPARLDHVALTSPQGRRLIIRIFPAEPRLAEDVRRVGLAALGGATDDAGFLRDLQVGLRAWYPRLTIHAQDDLASLMPGDRTWYAMRDGRVHLADPRIDRLHAALATARDLAAEADHALDRSRSMRAEFVGGRPRRKPDGEEDHAADVDPDA